MLKQLIFLGIACSVALCSDAQVLPDEERASPRPNPGPAQPRPRTAPTLAVTFRANHDYYLIVKGVSYGKITKDIPKTVKLNIGVNLLSFEEADSTGEHIESYFRVTEEMARGNDSVFVITFKNDLVAVVPSLSGQAGSAVSERTGTAGPAAGVRAVAAELAASMIPVEGGSFRMGSEHGQNDEAVHTVTISPVSFGKYEVTQKQWKAVMGYNRSGRQGCADCPVENVSWIEVDSFIRKLNSLGSGRFRLPTEAEWEFVASKGLESELGVITHPDAFQKKWESFLDRTTWYSGNAKKTTQPVGKKQALSGAFDLLGNVAEWCLDYYRPDYQRDKATDPRGPATGTRKVIKGGSFKTKDRNIRISLRAHGATGTTDHAVGFRLVSDHQ